MDRIRRVWTAVPLKTLSFLALPLWRLSGDISLGLPFHCRGIACTRDFRSLEPGPLLKRSSSRKASIEQTRLGHLLQITTLSSVIKSGLQREEADGTGSQVD